MVASLRMLLLTAEIAVMPYFPYSRQSKKKSHRGAITARLLANLLSMAGMSHLVTVDLHVCVSDVLSSKFSSLTVRCSLLKSKDSSSSLLIISRPRD